MLLAVLELPYILVAILVYINSLPGTFTVYVVTFVTVTAIKVINTFTMLHVILPVAHILVTVDIVKCPLSVTCVIFPLTFIF